MTTRIPRLCIMVLATAGSLSAWAHGSAGHAGRASTSAGSAEQLAFGRAGDPKRASRTIRVDMADSMRFTPDALTIRAGETVRFVVVNRGRTLHEMVLGATEDLEHHADLMRKHPGMEHDEPYMAHVKPGGRESMVWTFNRAGTFMFGCLLPGHFEAGMKGTITVLERQAGTSSARPPH